MKKRGLAVVLALAMVLSLAACGGNGLSGTYVSESGSYTVKFTSPTECTWYQDGSFFNGTYEKTDNGYRLEVLGGGFYGNTVFELLKDGKDFIVTGGVVYGERFVKGSDAPKSSEKTSPNGKSTPTPVGEDLGFAQTETFTDEFTTEDGHSFRYTVTIWDGKRGINGEAFHPTNNQEAIDMKNTNAYIPFEIYIENISKHDFSTDLEISKGSPYSPLYFLGSTSLLGMIHTIENTSAGSTEQILGYAKIEDYYSPQYPNGNFDEIADMMDNSSEKWYYQNKDYPLNFPIYYPRIAIASTIEIYFDFTQNGDCVNMYHYATTNYLEE